MKSKALYHLLLDRARHIRVHGAPETAVFITDIEDSLTVDFDKGEYAIAWRYQNLPHAIGMTDADFHFYIRGDLDKPPTLRDVRRGNWEAALDLWKRMAETSGQTWPEIVEDSPDSMGLDLAVEKSDGKFYQFLLILAGVNLFIGLIGGGFSLGVGTAIAGPVLALLSRNRDGLRAAPWSEKINAAAIALPAAIVPAFVPHGGAFGLGLIAGLFYLIDLIEKYRPFSQTHWLWAGGGIGVVAWLSGSAGLSWGLIAFAIFFIIIIAILPERFDRKAAMRACGLIAIGAILGLPAAPGLAVPILVWLLVILFASLSALGWFIGELFTLTPWMIHILLGFIALASALTGDSHMAGCVLMATGFAFAETARMVMALRGTRAEPLIKPERNEA